MARSAEDILGADPDETQHFDPDNWADPREGVTLTWLSEAFHMDKKKARAKLANCRVLGKRKFPGGTFDVYDLREAAAHLVPSVGAISHAIRSMTKSDLPVQLQEAYWDAKLKEDKWRKEAGQLYRAEDVAEFLGTVFLIIKNRLMLVPDTLEETSTLSNDQRRRVIEIMDAVQRDIHKEMVELQHRQKTKPVSDSEPAGGDASHDAE